MLSFGAIILFRTITGTMRNAMNTKYRNESPTILFIFSNTCTSFNNNELAWDINNGATTPCCSPICIFKLKGTSIPSTRIYFLSFSFSFKNFLGRDRNGIIVRLYRRDWTWLYIDAIVTYIYAFYSMFYRYYTGTTNTGTGIIVRLYRRDVTVYWCHSDTFIRLLFNVHHLQFIFLGFI